MQRLISITFVSQGMVIIRYALALRWSIAWRIFADVETSRIKIHIQSRTRNSSEYEIGNVNFLYVDIVHALQNTIQNTVDSCTNSARDRRGYVLERRFTKVSVITHCNSHYAVQGHSRSPILVPIESSYTTSYTNSPLITVSKLWLIIGHIFASEKGVPHFNVLAGVIPC